MTLESLPKISPESPKEILNKEDREVLEYTLSKFKTYLENIEAKDLPTVIIFPETSTRPIAYAIKPIVEKIYNEKNLPLPKMQFLLTVRSPEREEFGVDEKADSKKIKTLRKQIEHLRTPSGYRGDWDQKKYSETIKTESAALLKKRMEFQNESGWTKQREKRFKEIIEASAPGNILVVDDLLSSYESIEQVEALTNLIPSGHKIEYFILIDGREDKQFVSEKDYDSKIHTGLWIGDNILGLTKLWAFKGFSYGARPGAAWGSDYKTGSTEAEKVSMLGVKKPLTPSGYAEKTDNPDPSAMKIIREEMAQIGQDIAAQEKFDEIAWRKKLTPDIGDF